MCDTSLNQDQDNSLFVSDNLSMLILLYLPRSGLPQLLGVVSRHFTLFNECVILCFRSGCPMRIHVRASSAAEGSFYRITQCDLSHNHDLTEERYRMNPRNRALSAEQIEMVSKRAILNVNPNYRDFCQLELILYRLSLCRPLMTKWHIANYLVVYYNMILCR